MSSTTLESNKIPPSIRQRLRKLRSHLQRFLLVDGLSRVLAVVVVLALADVLLDRVFKMDLAQRGIMLVVMVAIVLAVLFFRLWKPFSKTVSDDALILQVEGKNRQLKESVISAAQFSRGRDFEEQGYSASMVEATIRHGSRQAENINFGSTLNNAALVRSLILLLVSLAGLGAIAYGVANTSFWRTWFNRNILLTNDLWPRQTRLLIDGVQDGALTLLRGEDHQQIVRVERDSQVTDVDVSIEFDDGGRSTRQKMRRTGDLEHALMFRNLASEFRFRARGGDHLTDWVQVRLVDAPAWSGLTMTARLPEYTGLGTQTLPPGGGPHPILEGSSLLIEATPNKRLSTASLKAGQRQWPLLAGPDGAWTLSIPAADLVGGKYTFDLADQDGLRSSRPATFTVKVRPDRAPSVRGTLLGISGLVVPRARIPVSYTVGDEFAITGMTMEHAWKGESSSSVPQQGSLDLTELDPDLAGLLGQSEIRSLAVLDLEPLSIPVDISLRLVLTATDNNTLSGPGTGKSREFLLRVVTEDELRADLLRREIEQRKAFEIVISSQEKLIDDLNRISDLANGSTDALSPDETHDRLRDAQRRQKLVGTNISRVADRFEEFLTEAMNNRLDEAEDEIDEGQSLEVRFNERIIVPIRELDTREVIQAAQLIEKTQRAVLYDPATREKGIDRPALVASTSEALDKQAEVLEKMRSILSAMQDSETYQEIVNKVIEIKRSEEKVREMARQKRDEAGDRDVFDDDGEDPFDDAEADPSSDDRKKAGEDG